VPGGTTDSITAGVDSVEAAMTAAPADTSPGTVVAAAMPPPPPPPPPARTATAGVSVVPADAVISRAEDRGFVGLGRTELSVARGDSIVLEFRRPGYVPEQRAFRGEPIQVRLVPDSVMVN